jgi:hypothetical protein
MASLYSNALNAQIRAALDLTLDENALPNETIQMPIYGPSGELDTLAADPNAATYALDSAQWQRAVNAVVYFTAARLAPRLPQILRERLGDYEYQRQAWDGAAKAAELRGLAQEEIAANIESDGEVEPLTGFWLASGCRGR